MPNDALPADDLCAACGSPVKKGAQLCPHCGARQKPAWSLRRIVAIAGIVVTFLSLAFAVEKLVNIYRTWNETQQQVQKHLAAVDSLVAVGDYLSAWKAIERAQQADPASARVRAVQVQVATTWIVDGQPVPTGWSPGKSAGAAEPATSSGRAAEQVSRALALAAAYAGENAAADLLALTVWTQFLRSRELLTQRRNFASELLQIAARHPGSHLANLFAGHWLAVLEDIPQSAWPYWNRAIDGPPETNRTRRFQIAALGSALRSSREDLSRVCRSMLVTVLNDMRRGSETMPDTLGGNWLTDIWLDRSNHFELPDRWPTAPPPAEQLDTLEWLKEGYEFSKYSAQPIRLVYIQGRLLEAAGRRQDALAAYRAADLSRANQQLAALFDRAVERLSGAPAPEALERDEWSRYTHQVSSLPPDSQAYQAALLAIKKEAGRVIDYGDPTLEGRFPPALDAAIASLSKWSAPSGGRSDDIAELKRQAKELLVARGRLHNRLSDFDNALRDLEPISSDPQAPQALRATALAFVAQAYADRSRRWAHSPEGDRLWEADIEEGFDRLQAAVTAGFDDWDWIEARLSELRRHSEYVKFSVAHGRMPPRDEKEE